MASKVHKPAMAVLAGPTRSFMAWAMVKTSKLSRPVRRFVIIRSSHLTICATDNARSQLMSVLITGATLTLTSSRNEIHIRSPSSSHRIWIQWYSDPDLRACRAAFEYANRLIANYFKLVTHRQLGKGRNSEVVFAFDTSTGDHAAVKIINKDKARHADREYAEREVRIRMTVQHPCIVQTLDIFESPYDLFVVMEHMAGGSLDRRISKQGAPLSENEARVIMRRLFAALDHLHERGIVHRNVKPQNMYFDLVNNEERLWTSTIKLSGFSLACHLNDPESFRQVVGTPEYLAPEASIMTNISSPTTSSSGSSNERGVVFGAEVDMWAAGVTLYNILSLELPFEGDFPPDVFKRARAGNPFIGEAFEHVSPQAISLIRSLLNVDRRKRPTTQTVMLHPWFAGPGADPCNPNDDSGWVWQLRGYDHTEGLSRFRSAASAVLMLVRLSRWTGGRSFSRTRQRATVASANGGDGIGRGLLEKRFASMDGVDIAPHDRRASDGEKELSYGNKQEQLSGTARYHGRATGMTRSITSTGTTTIHGSDGFVVGNRENNFNSKKDNSDTKLSTGNDSWSEYIHEVVHSGSGHAREKHRKKQIEQQKTEEEEEEEEGEGKSGQAVLQGRTSGTALSRVSTESSTVKSRSSAGTDSVAGVMHLTMGGLRNKVLGVTDARWLDRRRANGSLSSADGAAEVQRLMMQTPVEALHPEGRNNPSYLVHQQRQPNQHENQHSPHRIWRRWVRDTN